MSATWGLKDIKNNQNTSFLIEVPATWWISPKKGIDVRHPPLTCLKNAIHFCMVSYSLLKVILSTYFQTVHSGHSWVALHAFFLLLLICALWHAPNASFIWRRDTHATITKINNKPHKIWIFSHCRNGGLLSDSLHRKYIYLLGCSSLLGIIHEINMKLLLIQDGKVQDKLRIH